MVSSFKKTRFEEKKTFLIVFLFLAIITKVILYELGWAAIHYACDCITDSTEILKTLLKRPDVKGIYYDLFIFLL